MVLFGLVFGRWWKSTIVAAAVLWTVVVLMAADVSIGDVGVLGAAAAFGAANAAVGVVAHQTGLWIARRLRHDRTAAA